MRLDEWILNNLGRDKLAKIYAKYDRCCIQRNSIVYSEINELYERKKRRCNFCAFAMKDGTCYHTGRIENDNL